MEHADGYGVGQIDLPEGPRVQAPLAGKQAEFTVGQPLRGELDVMREDGDTGHRDRALPPGRRSAHEH